MRPNPLEVIAGLILVAAAVAAGVFAGEWLWWHHAASVAHDQLCRSFPGAC